MSEKLWQQFKGQVNSDEVIIKKAQAFTDTLLFVVAKNVKSLSKDVNEDKINVLFFELIYFYLHFIDRFSSRHISGKMRNLFMDTLIRETLKCMAQNLDSDIHFDKFHNNFANEYNTRQAEYKKFKKIAVPGIENPKGTLYWEFSKKIISLMGLNIDYLNVLEVYEYIANSVIIFQLPELLSE